MRRGWLIGLAVALALCLEVSCDDGKEVVAGLGKLQDRACECEDQKCAGEVLDDLVDFATEHKDAHGDEKAVKQAGEAINKTFRCLVEAGISQDDVIKAGKAIQKLQ